MSHSASAAAETIRARLFLITPPDPEALPIETLEAALSGGDAACLLIDWTDDAFAAHEVHARALIEMAQGFDIAAIVTGDLKRAERLGADGVQLAPDASAGTIEALQKKGLIAGLVALPSRHKAMEAGELQPDYLFFGRTDKALADAPHKKTADLALWWAQVMEVPAVTPAGLAAQSISELASGGVEFVAVGEQVWNAADPASAMRDLNARLDAAHLASEAA